MKAVNNKEVKIARYKFLMMYGFTTVLIIIILSSFWKPVPTVKTLVRTEAVKDSGKIIYLQQKADTKNSFVNDSLQITIDSYNRKIEALNAYIQTQKNTIDQLQQHPSGKPNTSTTEITKLNKQVEFLDWALRSQVAVTNTLTKENNKLKSDINELKANKAN